MNVLDLDDLAAFVAVAHTGSFKAAAVRLGRDGSVVSRRIAQLERKLGVKLLLRTTRTVTLTEAGSFYFQRLRSILDELDAATREVGGYASAPQGLLRISAPVTFGRDIVSPLIARIITAHPGIRIDAHFQDRVVDVVGEGFDLVVRVGSLPSSTLHARRLGSFRSVLVAAPAYRDRHGLPDQVAMLKEHRCLGFTRYPDWPLWTLEKDEETFSIQPDCSMVADNSEAILTCALEALGIALTPDWMAAPHLKCGALLSVLPGWRSAREVAIHALMPSGTLIPTKTRLFVDALNTVFRERRLR